MTVCSLLCTRNGRTLTVPGIFRVVTLSLLVATFACIPATADSPIPITECGTTISQPGHYILANDLDCSEIDMATTISKVDPLAAWGPLPDPFDGSTIVQPPQGWSDDGIAIVADHVDLLLNGHTINGNGSSGNGISVGVGVAAGNSHVHIIGPGTITGFGKGIIFQQVSFSSVTDMMAIDNFFNFVISGIAPVCAPACSSAKNDFHGNTTRNGRTGFLLQGANDNSLRDNNVSNSFIGIWALTQALGNDLRDNIISGNTGGIVLGFSLPFRNVSGNDITHNIVQNNGIDLADFNSDCGDDTWKHNTFGSSNQSCIQ